MEKEPMKTRDLQKEIKALEKSEAIKILGIETMNGILTRPVVETVIDSMKNTLEQINLDEIAASVAKDMREFQKNA
jgi:hypothetical protein